MLLPLGSGLGAELLRVRICRSRNRRTSSWTAGESTNPSIRVSRTRYAVGLLGGRDPVQPEHGLPGSGRVLAQDLVDVLRRLSTPPIRSRRCSTNVEDSSSARDHRRARCHLLAAGGGRLRWRGERAGRVRDLPLRRGRLHRLSQHRHLGQPPGQARPQLRRPRRRVQPGRRHRQRLRRRGERADGVRDRPLRGGAFTAYRGVADSRGGWPGSTWPPAPLDATLGPPASPAIGFYGIVSAVGASRAPP